MRLFLLTVLTMVAFAANSVLNRLALKGGHSGATDFAAVRVVSGALLLALLVAGARRRLPLASQARWIGAGSLVLYMIGFSRAYLALDAGTGALILFGGVQITMFAGALLTGETVPARRWAGAVLAFAGLCWLVWPGQAGAPAPGPAVSMAAAALGWGLYSLAGRRGGNPLAGTAANFLVAAPVTVLSALALRSGPMPDVTGLALACISGAITSGLGYALWYRVLPELGATRAAVAQLSVPVLALAGGVALVGETPSARLVYAAAVVMLGVALATVQRPRRA